MNPPVAEALAALAAGRELPPATDPEALVAAARAHRLGGVLFSRVRAREVELPPALNADLAARDVATQARHRRMWAVLGGITRQLEAAGVGTAVMKGVPAEARWYERTGERPCSDVDLLVNPDQRDAAITFVAERIDDDGLTRSLARDVERGLVASVDLEIEGFAVDLHLDPLKLNLPGQGRDLLWARTEPYALPSGDTIRVLDAEASLFHFLVTLNRDCFCWMLAFADVARLMRRDLDWDAVWALADVDGLRLPVAATLDAVVETLALPSPVVWTRHRGPRAAVWRALWRPAVRLQGEIGWYRFRHRSYAIPFLAEDRLGEALAGVARQLVQSPAVASRANPSARGPWVWRLVAGRVRRARERRRRIRELRARSGDWPAGTHTARLERSSPARRLGVRNLVKTAILVLSAVVLAACGSGGEAAISTGSTRAKPPTTEGPTVPKGRVLPAGEPKPACDLFNAGEAGDIVGNAVRPGTGAGRNCLWGTAVDRGSSVQLSVTTPGKDRAAQACTTQRNSLAKEAKQEQVSGVGTSAVWATQQLTLLLQGSLVACFEDAVILVILTGERDPEAMRNTAVAFARQAYSRL